MSPISSRTENNTIRENVYLVIKKSIAELKLAPGTVMSTQEIAERLNVSRTPVREAFIRLQKEDLVSIAPQKGTMVSRINLARAEQERFIRESLELAIIPLFLDQYSQADIQRLQQMISLQQQCLAEKNLTEVVHYDNLFHKVFFDVAGQNLSWETIINTNSHYNRLRMLTVRDEDTVAGAIRQHEILLQLVGQKDVEALRREFISHVQKINVEKLGLQKLYPDYFEDGTPKKGLLEESFSLD